MKQPNSLTKSQWPAWFPYPSSWLRALGLVLLLIGVIAILRIMVYWGFPVLRILSVLQEDPTPVIAFLIAVGFVVPIMLISYVHHILFGKSRSSLPRWLPTPKSLWVGFYGWVVINLSTVVSFGLVIPFIDTYGFRYEWRYSGFTETEATWLSVIWLITAAYLYQIEFLIQRCLALKSKTANTSAAGNKPESKASNVDDVDVEFDRLRGQMGLHKMKGRANQPRKRRSEKY